MNKTIPFGYHSIGNHTIIKLNMNLTPADADEIRKNYGFSVMYNSRKSSMLCRIEGIISHNNSIASTWFNQLPVYKINAKMEKLANRKASLLDIAIGAENLLVDLNDLPF
jgi:hypothetical protein